jgi:hypothetical protein
MAFGPGLTVETALFTRLAAPRHAEPAAAAPDERAAKPASQPVTAQA